MMQMCETMGWHYFQYMSVSTLTSNKRYMNPRQPLDKVRVPRAIHAREGTLSHGSRGMTEGGPSHTVAK